MPYRAEGHRDSVQRRDGTLDRMVGRTHQARCVGRLRRFLAQRVQNDSDTQLRDSVSSLQPRFRGSIENGGLRRGSAKSPIKTEYIS